jgi:hypothetical protein
MAQWNHIGVANWAFGIRALKRLGINTILWHQPTCIGDWKLSFRIDLESITLHLNKKHVGAIVIHAKINHVLGTGTIEYSIDTRYLRK